MTTLTTPADEIPTCESNLAPDEVRRLLRRLAHIAERCDSVTAFYLLEVDRRRLHDGFGHPDTPRFAEAELGFNRHKTYRLLRAARACERHPGLRQAFERGEVSYSKIDVIAGLVGGKDGDRWIDLARIHGRDVLRQLVDREERFAPREGPSHVLRVVLEADQWTRLQEAIERVRKVGGAEVGVAEALDVLAFDYLATPLDESEVVADDDADDPEQTVEPNAGELHGANVGRPATVTRDDEVPDEIQRDRALRNDCLARYGFACGILGCGCRVDLQVDHIESRAQNPSRRWDPDNVVPLCAGHHRLKTAGLLRVTEKRPDGMLVVERPARWREFEEAPTTPRRARGRRNRPAAASPVAVR